MKMKINIVKNKINYIKCRISMKIYQKINLKKLTIYMIKQIISKYNNWIIKNQKINSKLLINMIKNKIKIAIMHI